MAEQVSTRAEQVLEYAIEAAMLETGLPLVPCQQVWFSGPEVAKPPVILFRNTETEFGDYVDGPDAQFKYFEIDSRAPKFKRSETRTMTDGSTDVGKKLVGYELARSNAERITDYLRDKELLTHQLAAYDEGLDSSQQEGGYFSHVILIGMPAEIDAEIAQTIWQEAGSPQLRGA